jgi:hypothetical protein
MVKLLALVALAWLAFAVQRLCIALRIDRPWARQCSSFACRRPF